MYSNDAEHVAQTEQKRYIKELENELDKLEEENDKLSDDALLLQDKAADLNVQVKQLHNDNDELLGSNTQLSDQVSTYKSQLDAQKNVLAVASKSSEEARRLQKDSTKQLHRLEIENQRLRATVLEIEENEDILVNEIDTLVREKSKYQEQSEELTSKCDALYADLDEKARENSQLLQEKEKAQNDLEAEKLAHGKDLEEWQRKDAACSAEITRLLAELEQERAKQKESVLVKENEAFRSELAKMRREVQKLSSLYGQCQQDKNQAERDLGKENCLPCVIFVRLFCMK